MPDFGNTNIEATSYNGVNVSNVILCQKAVSTPASNGNLTAIKVYCKNSSSPGFEATLVVAIYADNGSGGPGALINSNTTGVTVGDANSWVSVPLTAALTAGTQYYFAWTSSLNNFNCYYNGSATGKTAYKDTTNLSMPFQNTFHVDTTNANRSFSIYGSYDESTGNLSGIMF